MTCPSLHFGAVAQQQRRVVQHAPDVEPRDREPLRPRVGEKRSDRVVQPLRLAQHDVHQLLLLVAERQLLPQHLDRARHRRQRIADLVRDAGGHLADRGEPLLQPRVALELLDVGDVLEREQQARRAARRLAGCVAVRPDLDLRGRRQCDSGLSTRRPRRVRALLVSSTARCGGSCSTSAIGRPTTDSDGMPVIASAARLNVRIAALSIGRRQAARQAVDDVLVERLQVGDLVRRVLEPRAGALQPLGQRAAQQRDREEAERR